MYCRIHRTKISKQHYFPNMVGQEIRFNFMFNLLLTVLKLYHNLRYLNF